MTVPASALDPQAVAIPQRADWLPGPALGSLFAASLARLGGTDDAAGTTLSSFVCPFCGCRYSGARTQCARCGGRPVVGREDERVYRTVHRLCGVNCDPDGVNTPPPER